MYTVHYQVSLEVETTSVISSIRVICTLEWTTTGE